jgi:putative ABC transport system permease protein
MLDIFQELYSTIRQNKLRTALTGFAVAWGILMLIVLLGAGNGVMNAFEEQSSNLASNSAMVGSWRTTMPYDGLDKGRRIQLHNKDVEAIARLTAHVEDIGATLSSSSLNVSAGNDYYNTSLLGVYPSYKSIQKVKMVEGRFINLLDNQEKRKVMVLYEKDAKTLFGIPKKAIGQFAKVGKLMYRIIGVYSDRGNNRDNDTYVPFTVLQQLYNKGNVVGRLLFTIKNLPTAAANEAFEKKLRTEIARQERFHPEDKGAIWVWNRFKNYLKQKQTDNVLKIAIWIIGIFTLISGIVGVSNIMLVTVRERTREFGIRKALGATPWSILWLIIAESVCITTLFGYIGMLAGVAITEYWANMGGMTVNAGVFQMAVFKNPTVDIGIAIQATITLIICGTLAGLFPALKAVRISPIEALRAD